MSTKDRLHIKIFDKKWGESMIVKTRYPTFDEMIYSKEVNPNFNYIVTNSKLTRKEVAKILCYSLASVNRWYYGELKLDSETELKFCDTIVKELEKRRNYYEWIYFSRKYYENTGD